MYKQNNYHGAGILPFCNDHPDFPDEICFLLLRETRIDTYTNECKKDALIDLGGKYEDCDVDASYTAVREMNEESNYMYQDESMTILDQIRNTRYCKFTLPGKKNYYIFCAKVPYREPAMEKLWWTPLSMLLAIKGDMVYGHPVSGRLLELLNLRGVRQKLATIG